MIGNKQGEWGKGVEKHSKQREQHVQRSCGKKHATFEDKCDWRAEKKNGIKCSHRASQESDYA